MRKSVAVKAKPVTIGDKARKYLFIGYNPPGHEAIINELNQRGCEVTTISDVNSAMDRIALIKPDMIIFRIYFQRGNLKLIIDPLANLAVRVGATLVIMSPRATEADIRYSVACGVSDFVLIPCEPKLLLRRLDYQMSRRTLVVTEELEEKSKELSSSLKLLSDVMRIISAIPDPHRRLYESLRLVGDFVKSPRVNMFCGKPQNEKALVVGSSDAQDVKRHVTKLEMYPEVREVLLKGLIVHVSDVSKNHLTKGLHQKLRSIKVDSIIVFPVKYKGRLLGALHVRLQKATTSLAQKHMNTFYTVALALGGTLDEIVTKEEGK